MGPGVQYLYLLSPASQTLRPKEVNKDSHGYEITSSLVLGTSDYNADALPYLGIRC